MNKSRLTSNHSEAVTSLFILVACLVLIGVGGFYLTRAFYLDHLPHYDSVGSYMNGYKIIQTVQEYGFSGAAHMVFSSTLSPLQNLYAYIFSPFLSMSEESFIWYNILAVTVAALGIFTFGHGTGLRGQLSALMALIFFIPDGLYWWDLGLLDYRRDPGMLGLMTGSFFLMLSYFTGQWSSRRRTHIGFMFGTVAGLTLISRDSAYISLFGVTVLPAIILWAMKIRTQSAKETFFSAAIPAIAFLPFFLIWLSLLGQAMKRFQNPMIAYGGGSELMQSMFSNIVIPFKLVFGTFSIFYNIFPASTLILFAVIVLGLIALRFAGLIGVQSFSSLSRERRFAIKAVLFSGLWIFVYVHMLLSLGVGLRTLRELPLIVLMAPYYPILIGFYALLAAGLLRIEVGLVDKGRYILLSTASVLILTSIIVRSETRLIYEPDWQVDAHRKLEERSSQMTVPPVILDISGFVRPEALELYAMARGNPLPRRFRYEFDGHIYDLNVATPEGGEEQVGRFSSVVLNGIRCDADFIIINDNMKLYENADHPLFVYSRARPLIESLLRDLRDQPRWRFAGDSVTINVIDNRAHVACSTNGSRSSIESDGN